MSNRLSEDLSSLRIDREPKNSTRRGLLRYALIASLVIGAVGAGYVYGIPYLESQVFRAQVAVTEISVVSPAQAQVELTATGYVVPQTVSLVGAQVPGRVAKVHIKEGDRVDAGAVLIELDKADQQAAIATARSRVAAAEARVETAKADLAEASQQADREKRLAEAGVSPKATLENLQARMESLKQNIKAAEAEVKAAQAETTSLGVRLDYLTIKAPISGTVMSKPPEVGELVGALTLEPLSIEIADFSSLVVECDVPEGRLNQVRQAAPAEIVLDAFPQKRFRGQTLDVSPKINRQKATVRVKVRFVDPADGVLPEMAARVSFLQKELDQASMKQPPKVVVPAAAVTDRAGDKVVFVVDGDRVRMTAVTLGAPFEGGFELVNGPRPGTRVVRNPSADLVDGRRIKAADEG